MVVEVNRLTLCQEYPKAVFWALLLFLVYPSELFFILENQLIGYADDSTLMAVVISPGVRVTVAESLIRDRGSFSELCDFLGMQSNAGKTNYWRNCADGV